MGMASGGARCPCEHHQKLFGERDRPASGYLETSSGDHESFPKEPSHMIELTMDYIMFMFCVGIFIGIPLSKYITRKQNRLNESFDNASKQ